MSEESQRRRREGGGARQVEVPADVTFQDLDGEAILLNLTSGHYFGLNESGTRMWNLLAEHGDVEVVYRRLLSEYRADGAQLRRDLERLIEELADQGLLRVRGRGPTR